jgi:hypothetical protein
MDITQAIAIAVSGRDVMLLLAAYVESVVHASVAATQEPDTAGAATGVLSLRRRAMAALWLYYPRNGIWSAIRDEVAVVFEAGTCRLRELTQLDSVRALSHLTSGADA